MDLIIKNARLRRRENLVDIAIHGEKIVRIGEKIKKAERIIDAEGRLTVPTFIDPHLHLDKASTFCDELANAKTISEARSMVREIKERYTVKDVKDRAGRVIQWAVSKGTTKMRIQADVDTIGGLTSLKGLMEAKKKYSDLVDIQIVAFPQEGIFQDQGAEELIRKAMELGADVVGGLPEMEMTDDDSKRHIDIVFEIAKEHGSDIDMHIDIPPSSRMLEYYAAKAIREGYHGRVTSIHLISLAYHDDYYVAKMMNLLKQAEMNVITCPIIMMFTGSLDRNSKGCGITRVKELIDAGVNVAYGSDDILNPYNPFGDADPLKIGYLLAYAAQLNTSKEIQILFDMPTFNSAKILNIEDYGIDTGKTANLNIIDTSTEQEAFRTQPERLYVINRGTIIAESGKIKTCEKLH